MCIRDSMRAVQPVHLPGIQLENAKRPVCAFHRKFQRRTFLGESLVPGGKERGGDPGAFFHGFCGDARGFIPIFRARHLLGEMVKRFCLLLPFVRVLCVLLCAGSQRACNDGNDRHDKECHPITRVVYGQCVDRGSKKPVEKERTRDAARDAIQIPGREPRCHDHRKQVAQDDIRFRKIERLEGKTQRCRYRQKTRRKNPSARFPTHRFPSCYYIFASPRQPTGAASYCPSC